MAIEAQKRVPLSALAAVFFRIGLFSFGGGLGAWLHRETVALRGWLTHDEFMAGLALGQILPGANVTNLAVYIGQRLRGGAGAVTALLSLLVAPFVLILVLARLSELLSGSSLFHAAMDGVAAAAVGLVLNIGVLGAQRFFPQIVPILVMAATFVAIGVLRLPLIPVVLVIAPISVVLAYLRRAADAR
ncbi:MAG TPA: chromate transporter [Beijerinckiaceae bacterium]|nr:chromate transporter [Beijerinckiaceae bacterium]